MTGGATGFFTGVVVGVFELFGFAGVVGFVGVLELPGVGSLSFKLGPVFLAGVADGAGDDEGALIV